MKKKKHASQKNFILMNRVIRDLGKSAHQTSINGLRLAEAHDKALRSWGRERKDVLEKIGSLSDALKAAHEEQDPAQKAKKLANCYLVATSLLDWYSKTPKERRGQKKWFFSCKLPIDGSWAKWVAPDECEHEEPRDKKAKTKAKKT